MTKVLVRIRILPESVDTDLDELSSAIEAAIGDLATILRKRMEPIAFGLNALIVDFALEEGEGGTYELESRLSEVEGVSQFDILGVSRLRTGL